MPRNSNNREYIFNEAMRLFSEQGYEATTVRQIAKASQVNEASIYHYFDSKEAILDEIFRVFRAKPKSYILTRKQIDAYLRTDTPNQLLRRFIPSCKAEDALFMTRAYRIVYMQQFVNPKANELVREHLIKEAAEGLEYALKKLSELEQIPGTDNHKYPDGWKYGQFSMVWSNAMFGGLSINGFTEDCEESANLSRAAIMGRYLINMLNSEESFELHEISTA